MTLPLFLAPLAHADVGAVVILDGTEGHHAVVVKRTRVGERILVADGAGSAVEGEVVAVAKGELQMRVDAVHTQTPPPVSVTVVQALPKQDRGELAVQAMTELGVARVVPWAASRCITSWTGPKAAKQHGRWVSAAREATKQSRRFTVPGVPDLHTTRMVAQLLAEADVAIVLHEDTGVASVPLATVHLTAGQQAVAVVGPEGGLTDDELNVFQHAGARLHTLGEGVLRTSTAGVVALAQLRGIVERGA